MKKKDKQEFEDIKKTVEAYGEFSEEEAQKKAQEIEEITKEIITKGLDEDVIIKDIIKEKETIKKFGGREKGETILKWEPKTKLGRDVKEGKITNIDNILNNNRKILEPEIVDLLIEVKSDLISIGQSKGKFGGGKRRAWRQTQRKTKEGNVPTFSTMAVVGDEDGHVGIGTGRAKETLPARDKAIRKAKLNIIRIKRDCASFDCNCNEKHTIPFKVEGKAGSVRVTLVPAPQGTGLVAGREMKKILKLVGIKDIYSRTEGKKRTSFNLAKACIDALIKTTKRERKKEDKKIKGNNFSDMEENQDEE